MEAYAVVTARGHWVLLPIVVSRGPHRHSSHPRSGSLGGRPLSLRSWRLE